MFVTCVISFRGDKKAICNKFVQTVSKQELTLVHFMQCDVFASEVSGGDMLPVCCPT